MSSLLERPIVRRSTGDYNLRIWTGRARQGKLSGVMAGCAPYPYQEHDRDWSYNAGWLEAVEHAEHALRRQDVKRYLAKRRRDNV